MQPTAFDPVFYNPHRSQTKNFFCSFCEKKFWGKFTEKKTRENREKIMKLLGSADVGLLINRLKYLALAAVIYYMINNTYQLGFSIFKNHFQNFKKKFFVLKI